MAREFQFWRTESGSKVPAVPGRTGGTEHANLQGIEPSNQVIGAMCLNPICRKPIGVIVQGVNRESGAAGEIRTLDLVLRRHALYPSELQPHAPFYTTNSRAVPGWPFCGPRRLKATNRAP